MSNSLNSNITTKSILDRIGFINSDNVLKFDFENCKLIATRGLNQYFQEGFNVSGYYISKRTSGEFDFFLPLEFDSYEQGLAFISYNLRNAEFTNKPDWFVLGSTLYDHLPWEKERKAFANNPTATIDSEWIRILINKLRILISISGDEDVTTFEFTNNILKVICNTESFAVSGTGKDWSQIAIVKTKSLDFLPKRISNKKVTVYIWNNNLYIGNRAFKLE